MWVISDCVSCGFQEMPRPRLLKVLPGVRVRYLQMVSPHLHLFCPAGSILVLSIGMRADRGERAECSCRSCRRRIQMLRVSRSAGL